MKKILMIIIILTAVYHPVYASEVFAAKQMLGPAIHMNLDLLADSFLKTAKGIPASYTNEEFDILRNYWKDAFLIDIPKLAAGYPDLAGKVAKDSMYIRFGAGSLIPEFRKIIAKEDFLRIEFIIQTRGLIVKYVTDDECYYLKPYQDLLEKKIIDRVREIGIARPFLIKWGDYFVEDETKDIDLTTLARNGLISPEQVGEIVGTALGELDAQGILYVDKPFPGNYFGSHIYIEAETGDVRVIDFGNVLLNTWTWMPMAQEEDEDMDKIMKNIFMLSEEEISQYAFYDLQDRAVATALIEMRIFYSAQNHFDDSFVVRDTENFKKAKAAFEHAYQQSRYGEKKLKDMSIPIKDLSKLYKKDHFLLFRKMEQSI